MFIYYYFIPIKLQKFFPQMISLQLYCRLLREISLQIILNQYIFQ